MFENRHRQRRDTASAGSLHAENEKPQNEKPEGNSKQYPTGWRLALIFLCLALTVFLVALDGTIIATAVPTITSQFNSLSDVSWYYTAYLLTTSAFQLPYGRAYTLLSTKWTFLSSIVIFEIGSAVCGAAPTSVALIVGRAISGLGGAGIFCGAFVIIADSVPLSKRAIFNGVIGGTFAIASVIGPILGGAFTTNVTWRWCFYINLPLGGVIITIVAFVLPQIRELDPNRFKNKTKLQLFLLFDPIGTVIFIPSIICLLLALTWGGQTYPWSDGRIIALFLCFGVSLIVWVVVQYLQGDNATISSKVAGQQTVICASIYTFLLAGAFAVIVYYLPIWFQAIKQDNAEQSGIHQLPTVISVVISSLVAGGLVVVFGYYVPWLYVGVTFSSIGAGLLTTLEPDSSVGTWIGYQIIFAIGCGVSLEQCNIAIQTVLPQESIPAGTALVVFARGMGSTVAASVAQNIFNQRLRSGIASAVPNLDSSVLNSSGATNLVANVRMAAGGNEEIVNTVLRVYNQAIANAFYVAVVCACLAIIPTLGVEWKSVKEQKQKKATIDEETGGPGPGLQKREENKNVSEDRSLG